MVQLSPIRRKVIQTLSANTCHKKIGSLSAGHALGQIK